MNLFMIYIGGKHKSSLIELHDIRFMVADTIEQTYEDLRKSWWGTQDSLHLDSWGILKSVENYDIQLKKVPGDNKNKLYFVNLGGYDAKRFTELHENICVVAESEFAAKEKAKQKIAKWESPHKDYLHSVENIFNIQEVVNKKELYIDLQPTTNPSPFEFTSEYVPIGRKS